MRILGIDPGLATIGFGVIEKGKTRLQMLTCGHISTPKTLSTVDRLNEIATDIEALCQTWKPDVCAIEEIYFSKNVTTAIRVAEARGVILQTLTRSGYSVHEYNPQKIKIALTGDGKADKAQMQKMITLILELKEVPKPDDAADALAIALCHAQTRKELLSD